MLCRLAEHWVYIAILPRPITTLTAFYTMIAHSVRYSKKMINPHDFWFSENWASVWLWQRGEIPYFLVYGTANFELRTLQKGLA